MALRKKDGTPWTADEFADSETVPKVCLVAAGDGDANITTRYFTPQTPHNSLAVTGGCCLAVACLLPGTVAHSVASGLEALGPTERETVVAMRNPGGHPARAGDRLDERRRGDDPECRLRAQRTDLSARLLPGLWCIGRAARIRQAKLGWLYVRLKGRTT